MILKFLVKQGSTTVSPIILAEIFKEWYVEYGEGERT